MTVEPLVPDAPPAPAQSRDDDLFARALDGVAAALMGATRAEDAFAYGHDTLQDAIYERAQADVALSVATATAARLVQALQTVFNMQV